ACVGREAPWMRHALFLEIDGGAVAGDRHPRLPHDQPDVILRHGVEDSRDRSAFLRHDREAGIGRIPIAPGFGDLFGAHPFVLLVLRLPRTAEHDAVPGAVLAHPSRKILVLLDLLPLRWILQDRRERLRTALTSPHGEERAPSV